MEEKLADRALNILQILRSPIGGLFRHVVDLSLGLIERGHRVGIVLDGTFSNPQSDGLLNKVKDKLELGYHILPMSRLLSVSDITTPIKMRSLAKSLNVDILHGHGAKGAVNARFARNKKSVAIYTPHGGVLNYNKDSFAGKMFRLAEKIMLIKTDAIIFESEHAKREFYKQITAPSCPNPVIHNGLSAEEFIKVKTQENAKDFAFIGEFRHLKGINYLLDALADVKRPDGKDATLILAGGGKTHDEIVERINKPDLKGRVELAGVRPAREILAKGRCLVVSSLKESLPYVVLEASAAACPIIATRVGGINEIFGPTEDKLIPPANVEALKRAMQNFLRDEKQAQNEADIRYKHVKKNFSTNLMVNKIETLYYSCLHKKK